MISFLYCQARSVRASLDQLTFNPFNPFNPFNQHFQLILGGRGVQRAALDAMTSLWKRRDFAGICS